MVTKAELVSIARRQKLPLGMIEKDFILTLVLREIYNSEFKNTLVFKGVISGVKFPTFSGLNFPTPL